MYIKVNSSKNPIFAENFSQSTLDFKKLLYLFIIIFERYKKLQNMSV